jgi:CHAT domain-containing protein
MKPAFVQALAGVVLLLLLAAMQDLSARDQEGKAEAMALYRRAESLKKANKMQEAARIYEQAVAKATTAFGANDSTTGILMNNLADLYRGLGQYDKAEPLLRRSLKIVESNHGKNHANTATSLNNLAQLYQARGKYDKALPLYRRSLKILEEKLGRKHLYVAHSLHNLANLYQLMEEYDKALPLFLRHLDLCEARRDPLALSLSLNDLALLYRTMGQDAKAEPLFDRSLKICQDKLGKDHLQTAATLQGLAVLYKDMGQYARAEPFYQRSLKIIQDKLPGDHPEVARYLNNLAVLKREMGQYDQAETLYRRALKIGEARFGKDHPWVATSLNNLAALHKDLEQYDKAEALHRRSLQIQEARGEQLAVAISLNNLAALYKDMKQHDKAVPLYARASRIWQDKLGEDHPYVAAALNNLGELHLAARQYDKALPLFQQALKIRQKKLNKEHPHLAVSLNNLAELYARTGQPEKAAALFDRARRSARRYLAAVLPGLTERDKAGFFANTGARADLEKALSLALAHKKDADLAALSAAWLAGSKGSAQESLASALLLARQNNDSRLGKIAQKLLSIRQQLARLTLSTPYAGQEKQRSQQIETLTSEEQELGKQLRQAGSKGAVADWVELTELRKALPANAVLIDVAHFRVFDFAAKAEKTSRRAAHYAAWVTPKKGPVQLIDLGSADKIDAAIKSFRAAMKDAGKHISEQGEGRADKALRAHLDALSELVLTPLLPHIGRSKRWVISPDGNLWLVPFEALTLADGTFAIEKHTIGYLTSGRDLAPSAAPKVKTSAPLVLADPDFDLDPQRARAEAKRLLGKETAHEQKTRSLAAALRRETVGRLEGTGEEARAITPSLKSYAGVEPRVYLREQALETIVKSVRCPRVLVLCTHGFFEPDPSTADKGKPEKQWHNPLLRCGLLLAGCNKAGKETDGDDGVLTGLEVVGTDLRGTELVVLSACETGLGEVQIGEGVAGLRRAFQLAGTRAVVSTLWKVPDKESARLMTLFFRNLSKGSSRSAALRAAKVQIIKERRDDYAVAHPFFWAAFTLTGER